MKKALLIFLFLVFGTIYGLRYIESPEFQKYADEQKAPWTCQVNNLLGNYYVMKSDYQIALNFFKPVLKRCEKTPAAEEAEFKIAVCLQSLGNRSAAAQAYRQYVEKYKNTRRTKIAQENISILSGV